MGSTPGDIVLFSTQRSGTHFVSSLLASVDPRIVALGEVLHPKSERSFAGFLAPDADPERALTETDPQVVRARFDAFLEDRRVEPHTILTVIWMYNQVGRLPEATREALFDGRRVVHLVRRNVLRTHVSDHINKSGLKTPHARGETQSDAPLQVELPTAGLRRKLRRRRDEIEQQRTFLQGIDHIELAYEDVDADPTAAIAGVSAAFGLATGVPRSGLRKSNPQSLRDLLSNCDEVEDLLAESSFAHLLDS